ncbi:MAG: phosphoribosylglycinamide formyltransferase [Ectothiorhodospiraceae bacterium]|nr:phosphoribosylglycinamide formyltransferase [Ectothiorhodospiraceae bacterium]
MPIPKFSIVILISGSGSNLQAIIDAAEKNTLPVEICAVISNRPDAKGLQRAARAGLRTEVVDHTQFNSREDFDASLQQCIDNVEPQLVVLAGFMRLLTDNFVDHYSGHMLNIHPSLLPNFKGLNTHARALAAFKEGSVTEHGASVHFVTAQLDGGPVIAQASVAIAADDTPDILATRVLGREHQLYPQIIGWFAEGRLRLQGNQVWLDEKALTSPVVLSANC